MPMHIILTENDSAIGPFDHFAIARRFRDRFWTTGAILRLNDITEEQVNLVRDEIAAELQAELAAVRRRREA